jgi:hypothetical protein
MLKRAALFGWAFVLVTACSESVGPAREAASPGLSFGTSAAAGITLDQYATVSSESYAEIGQGFNPTNPHVGDAIIATFFWRGTTNTITRVVDHLADGTPVGNTYTLVEYVTAGGFSMATYVATNVQNFPDPNPNSESVLNVDAIFTGPVSDGGAMLSAWTGVNAVVAQALGAHRAATGSGAGITSVGPGAIALGPGALAYAVTMSNSVAGREPPAGFNQVTTVSDTAIALEANYAVHPAGGSVDPQWTWYFPDSPPSDWLTTVLALNPPLHFEFIIEPSTTLPTRPIEPAIQVMALDADGNRVTSFNGPVTIAIGRNGGMIMAGRLSGTVTVPAVDGVATFSNLSIDQLGNGYTLTVSAAGVTGATSASFNIGAF